MKEVTTPIARVSGARFERYHVKTYETVSSVLCDAGFECHHMHPILDETEDDLYFGPLEFSDAETLEMLSKADFVLIDATFAHINFEKHLRFCRALERSPDSILVIKRGRGTQAPISGFGGFFFRDRAVLAQRLRLHFGMSKPLSDDQVGYVFVFDTEDRDTRIQDFEAAAAVFSTLKKIGFSGRCEICVREDWISPRRSSYILCVGLRERTKSRHRKGAFWPKFTQGVPEEIGGQDCGLNFASLYREFAYMDAIRRENRPVVEVELRGGEISHVYKPQFCGDSFRGLALALAKKSNSASGEPELRAGKGQA